MLNLTGSTHWKDFPGIWRLFSLRNKLRDSFHHVTTFGRPFYDLSHYLWNLEARKLYELRQNALAPDILQQRVVREIKEKGISVIHVNDFLPEGIFSELQKLTEALMQRPKNRTAIKELQIATSAVRTKENLYLVYLLGDKPVLSLQNQFLIFSLRDEILRIVCGYLGMLCRLQALNVWCNVPMTGPDRFSQRWHRDPDDKKLLKLFLYLRDVDENTGPFCYIPGTHNGGPLKKIYRQTIKESNYPPEGMIEKLFPQNQRLACVGRAGTLIFCDTTGIHRGGNPVTAPRLLFNAVYTTNAGAVLTQKRAGKFYSIAGKSLGPLGAYAVGLESFF